MRGMELHQTEEILLPPGSGEWVANGVKRTALDDLAGMRDVADESK